MSDFSISAAQRLRLLEGDYRPLVMSPLPYGCEPGARYVLAWQRATALATEDGLVYRTPRLPVWFLSVTKVVRRTDGGWLVRFDIVDRRDRDLFLRPGGGVQAGRDVLDAGCVPDPEWLDSEAEAISEFWEQERLRRLGDELKRRASWKRERREAA